MEAEREEETAGVGMTAVDVDVCADMSADDLIASMSRGAGALNTSYTTTPHVRVMHATRDVDVHEILDVSGTGRRVHVMCHVGDVDGDVSVSVTAVVAVACI